MSPILSLYTPLLSKGVFCSGPTVWTLITCVPGLVLEVFPFSGGTFTVQVFRAYPFVHPRYLDQSFVCNTMPVFVVLPKMRPSQHHTFLSRPLDEKDATQQTLRCRPQ
ncbi:hypothetical protein P152DRAFT_44284 [Eremomyces bilateralis CBS 781.70]|uniref:Uncharacterized protein n=1 Tax=Eremomyces bilateralis CBS 781.70 TaxID=1392243 RepID=A0A6G1G268_9PEZI|nr:uncharacterized protein P152DRAFT_44284 [Eremomyces bilateralis CBS 781.70]KAF1812082.1 hypothetical protein P152DRAFT_44284 [Eremomyces bilateralis CBS 781.70]